MSVVEPASGRAWDIETPVAIVGAGACGLVAALSLREAGVECLVLEADKSPTGSTSLSSGMVPACGTRFQRDLGVDDDWRVMAADIQRKAHDGNAQDLVDAVCRESGPTIEWLADRHRVPFELVTGFLYPGHSRMRMHAPPSRTGAELMAALIAAARREGVEIATEARVTALHAEPSGWVRGLRLRRPDGRQETVGCRALVLSCCGFGANPDMIARHIPEMVDASYFGHPGNRGEAVAFGQELGAGLRHMGAYQGHGSVATPHGILITWALIMEGGIQVNRLGLRFSDESQGYSEQAVNVLAQPERVAWTIYDERIHRLGRDFEDYRNAEAAGAIKTAPTVAALASLLGLPAETLGATIGARNSGASDPWGRDFSGKPPLKAPFYAVKVTGALFHTQGGLAISPAARVLRTDGSALPNLFAGGGAAEGLSGETVDGYLSGNGLLSAVVLGRIAGCSAARLIGEPNQAAN
jgi:fumarate reductase flavoprotein subunit